MIGNEGEYLLSVSCAGKKDFIREEELLEFTVIEEVGNLLPTFQAQFTADDDMRVLLNEGNSLNVQFGKTLDSLNDYSFVITKSLSTRAGFNRRTFNIAGILDKLAYNVNPLTTCTKKMSAFDVIKQHSQKYFKFVSNTSSSKDSQNWISHGISMRNFLLDVWTQADMTPSFPICAILADGKFILHDFKKLLASGHKFKLTPLPKEKKDVPYASDYIDESQTGLINTWLGYGRTILIQDEEGGSITSFTSTTKTMLALTKESAKNQDIETRFGGVQAQNSNIYKNSNQVYLHNITSLANLKKVRLTLNIPTVWVDISPLDIVMLNEIDTKDNTQSSEYFSGLYIVSKRSRTISDRQMSTSLQILREAYNSEKVGSK